MRPTCFPHGHAVRGVLSVPVAYLIVASLLGATAAQADIVVRAGEATIQLRGETGELAATRDELRAWVRNAAAAVTAWYGEFPVPRVDVTLQTTRGNRVVTGTAYGRDVPQIEIRIGREANAAALADDWVLPHEMVHLAFPDLPERHSWLEEGIATYVEPFARAQAGQLTPEQSWGGLVRDLHKGLPQRGDRGLDNTHTWGRTYWGGALFCLLADVEIRRRTDNRKGLQDALRGIVRAGGHLSVNWPVARALRIGDEATGVPVLSELYARMATAPVATDLDDLWQRLGIRATRTGIRFRATAPLAAARRAITTGGNAQSR